MNQIENSDRAIKVNKKDLIVKVKANKKAHIKQYKDAVKSYEALAVGDLNKYLEDITAKVKAEIAAIEKDGTKVRTRLVRTDIPVDNTEKYEDIISIFEWDVEDEVVLTQPEFLQYVNDKTPWAVEASVSNLSVSDGAFFNTQAGHFKG